MFSDREVDCSANILVLSCNELPQRDDVEKQLQEMATSLSYENYSVFVDFKSMYYRVTVFKSRKNNMDQLDLIFNDESGLQQTTNYSLMQAFLADELLIPEVEGDYVVMRDCSCYPLEYAASRLLNAINCGFVDEHLATLKYLPECYCRLLRNITKRACELKADQRMLQKVKRIEEYNIKLKKRHNLFHELMQKTAGVSTLHCIFYEKLKTLGDSNSVVKYIYSNDANEMINNGTSSTIDYYWFDDNDAVDASLKYNRVDFFGKIIQ